MSSFLPPNLPPLWSLGDTTAFSKSVQTAMVDWSSPAEIARDSAVFERLMYAFLGVVLWELFVTSGFEWSLITRRRKFRWPLIFFFSSRYCIVLACVGLVLSLAVTSPVNCSALYTFNSWAGNMSILGASTSLMLRTIALWERRKAITIPLIILCVAHWAVLYRGMFVVHATWNDEMRACEVTQANSSVLNITFFFTMGFDFVILVFTFIALISKHTARTDLWKLLFTDGLVYFLVSFSTNCIPAVLNVLNLNTAMNVIATVPAAAVSSIAACRAVMRLLDFHTADVYIYGLSGIEMNQRRQSVPLGPSLTNPILSLSRPEVRVTTERITVSECTPPPLASVALSRSSGSCSVDIESGRDISSQYDSKEGRESSNNYFPKR